MGIGRLCFSFFVFLIFLPFLDLLLVYWRCPCAGQCSQLKPHFIERPCMRDGDGAWLFWAVVGKSGRAGSGIGSGQ